MLVFISHTSTEDEFVSQLARVLNEFGVTTWTDHLNIKPGEAWGEALLAALKRSDTMIVVLSKEATTSNSLPDQWIRHHEENNPIILVRIEPCAIPPELKSYTLIEFSDDYDQSTLSLLRTLGVSVNMETRPLNATIFHPRKIESPAKTDESTEDNPE